MQINIIWDSSVADAPAGFQQAVEAACQYYESLITNDITINLSFGWGEVGGQAIDPGAVAESLSTLVQTTAGVALSKLADVNGLSPGATAAILAMTPGAQTASAALPMMDVSGHGEGFFLTLAQARALGYFNQYNNPTDVVDGYIGLDSSLAYTFDPNNRSVAGAYDAIGALEHEISEVLGRISGLGQPLSDQTHAYTLLDFYRYAAPGEATLAPDAGSFSFDGGRSLLLPFDDPSNGGDAGDWSQDVTGDSYDAFVSPGEEASVSTVDLRVLEALGYTLSAAQDVVGLSDVYPTTSANGTVSNAGGVLTVQATAVAADAAGMFGGLNVDNTGQMVVSSAAADAWGVFALSSTEQFVNAAGAALTISAAHQALGVYMANGGAFTNAGTIQVTGETAYGEFGATSFNNSGTLKVTATGAGEKSVAVDINYPWSLTYTNSGAILGDYAFLVDLAPDILTVGNDSGPSMPGTVVINNSGQITGEIGLSDSYGQIHNTGSITGAIHFGDYNSVYDGAGGTQSGGIYLGQGTNTVTLGNDGEAVFGGDYDDTITGGAGNDFIEIGRGTNTIDGGGGINILSFADADMGVTVDLGAGTAYAGGADTIKNIQEVIGSSFDDTLKAGAAAAELVGGAGDDTLVGGAGNDTLVAGAGGATMTGGGGSNTFVYSAGDHQVVITDFGANGDQDLLDIYGYAGGLSVLQQGADTLITLSATDSIVLKNVQASALTGANLVYSLGSFSTAPAEPAGPPIFGTHALAFNFDLTIAADEVVDESDQPVALTDVGLGSGARFHSFSNFGTVNVSADTGDVTGLATDSSGPVATSKSITNEAGATFSVTDTSATGTAKGFDLGNSPPVTNAGQLTVTANGLAYGVFTNSDGALTNAATGVIEAQSSSAAAYGVEFYLGHINLANNGEIEASGVGSAYGVFVYQAGFDTLANSGSIVATASGSGGRSYGVVFQGSGPTAATIPAPNTEHFTNTGSITADTAISVIGYVGSFVPVAVTNSGAITGAIDLSQGAAADSVVNTGRIVGAVELGDGYETYNGVGGTQSGGLYLGRGESTVALGDDGERVFNGGGDDTITGGAGNDFVEVMGGSSTIDGGGGSNTLSFADAAAGVTVDLGKGYALASGIDTIKNIQEVIGSAYDDTLIAGSTAATLVGGAGDDTLVGAAGNDTLVASGGGSAMTGGGGNNTFVYQAGDHQAVITDFGRNGDQDVLDIYGYAGAQSVTQQGADTLITLSATDSILLKNVQASALTSGNVVYSTSAWSGSAVPAAPPTRALTDAPQETLYLSVSVGTSLSIAAGTLSDVDLGGASLGIYVPSSGWMNDLGAVYVGGSSGTVVGVGLDPTARASFVRTNAIFSVSNSGGAATGIEGGASPSLENMGLVTVTASGLATGLSEGQPLASGTGYSLQNDAGARIQVISSGGEAIGLNLDNNGDVDNEGTLQVEALGAAYGIEAEAEADANGPGFASGSIVNVGTLAVASLDPNAATYGVAVSSTALAGQGLILNTGTITAKVAILDQNAGSGFESLTIVNRGTINGDIDLGGSNSTLTSYAGAINGDVHITDGSDTIDLRPSGSFTSGGTVNGRIDIAPTLSGQADHDVIYTGLSGGLISIHGGDSALTVSVTGGGGQTTVQFDEASSAVTYTHNADGSWTVNAGADGIVTVANVQTLQFTDKSVATSSIAQTLSPGSPVTLSATNGTWSKLSGSGGSVNLNSAQASVFGGDDRIYFDGSASNAVSLYETAGNWDTVTGNNGSVNLNAAQASVLGGNDWVYFSGSAGNSVSLYNTAGDWDTVKGSSGSVNLNASQASVLGGDDWIYFNGSVGSAVSLYGTANNWDTVTGSNGSVNLSASQASVLGGGDRLYFDGSASDAVSLYKTNGNWDTVTGSNGGVSLSASQASVLGGNDRVYFDGSSSDTVSLYNTKGSWDTVSGSNGGVNLYAAQASVLGGSDRIYFDGSSNDAVSLYNTKGNWDTVTGGNGLVILNGAQATVIGSNDTINLAPGSTVTANGQSEAFVLQQASFGDEWISGFNSSDVLTFAKSDWASFSALQASGAMTQSGADTVIRLDAADAVTLYNVTASSLTASQFSFK